MAPAQPLAVRKHSPESLSSPPGLASELSLCRGAGKARGGWPASCLGPGPLPWVSEPADVRAVLRCCAGGLHWEQAQRCGQVLTRPQPSALNPRPSCWLMGMGAPGHWAEGLYLHKDEWPWPEPEAASPWMPGWSAQVQGKNKGQWAFLVPHRCRPPSLP